VSILLKLKGSWAAIRWKILIIFTFFISASLTHCVAEWSAGVEQFDETTILVLTAE
jgi:hypothetical protein